MYKMITKGRETIITDGEHVKFTGRLEEALQYVYHLRFIALVKGERIGQRIGTLYPVRRLVPRTKQKITINYVIAEEEAV